MNKTTALCVIELLLSPTFAADWTSDNPVEHDKAHREIYKLELESERGTLYASCLDISHSYGGNNKILSMPCLYARNSKSDQFNLGNLLIYNEPGQGLDIRVNELSTNDWYKLNWSSKSESKLEGKKMYTAPSGRSFDIEKIKVYGTLMKVDTTQDDYDHLESRIRLKIKEFKKNVPLGWNFKLTLKSKKGSEITATCITKERRFFENDPNSLQIGQCDLSKNSKNEYFSDESKVDFTLLQNPSGPIQGTLEGNGRKLLLNGSINELQVEYTDSKDHMSTPTEFKGIITNLRGKQFNELASK